VALGQEDAASGDALRLKTMCEPLCGFLAAAVGINIEREIDGAPAVAQLSKLAGVEGSAQRTGEVAKPRLPQHGIVKQSLDENHVGALPNLLPGIQPTLGAREESMSAAASILRP
jgi:hypothetical protein